ncbi:MAG: hypothetical protein Q8J97_12485, partial [Flavobacteriaceae bacterium]|nr:hypothetical protein [Flavobacteriaceae bacterium]
MRPLYIISLIAALAVGGCKSNKPLIKEHSLNVKDSVSVVWKVIDTAEIARPAAKATLTIRPTETRDTTIKKRVDHAELTIRQDKGVLTATCTCDSLKAKVKQYQKEISRLREIKEKTIEPVVTNKLTAWQRFF